MEKALHGIHISWNLWLSELGHIHNVSVSPRIEKKGGGIRTAFKLYIGL